MEKRRLHHYWIQLREWPALLFAIVGILLLFISIPALRANNLKMLELREAVFEADEQNGDIETPLRALREHVYSHMNTDLTAGDNSIYPPIQLKHRYERLVAAEKDRVGTTNAKVASDAQAVCEQRFPNDFSGRVRVPCTQEYIQANGVKEQPIPEDLYKFDFASPSWSPDLAGWSLSLGILSLGLSILTFVIERGLRQHLRRHA